MGQWLKAYGRDGQKHVIYLPERDSHVTCAEDCLCGLKIEDEVVMHGVLTAACRPKNFNDH